MSVGASERDSVSPAELGGRLQAARKAARKTQEDVAAELGIARTTVIAIEKGDRRVSATELLRLAQLYGKSLNELMRPSGVGSALAIQLRASLPRENKETSELEPYFAEFQSLAEDYAELERLCSAPLPRRYPEERRIEGVSAEAMAEDVAQSERRRLGIGDGPIHQLREILEREVGLRVFHLPMPSYVSGMFIYDERLGGCIAANGRHTRERVRHSVAHEYAHFLTSRHQVAVSVSDRYRRIPEHERFAHAFAPAFLLPESGLKSRFHQMKVAGGGNFVTADLVSLAHYYGVSVESLALRLEDLRLVPRGTRERIAMGGLRVGEAKNVLGLVDEPDHSDLLPSRYVILAVHALADAAISEGQFARFLRTDFTEARRVYRAYQDVLSGGGNPIVSVDRGGTPDRR